LARETVQEVGWKVATIIMKGLKKALKKVVRKLGFDYDAYLMATSNERKREFVNEALWRLYGDYKKE